MSGSAQKDRVKFPYSPELITPPETHRRLQEIFPDYAPTDGLRMFGPGKYVMPPDAGPFLEAYMNTPLYKGDIWVVTLPKCGTTWMQELVWLVANDCDFEGAKSLLLPDRWHFLEIAGVSPPAVREKLRVENDPTARKMFFDPIENRPHPWFVKTHLPLEFCPPKLLDTCKTIYVVRNPKDMCVSYYHHMQLYKESSPDLTLEEFATHFINGHVSQIPFFPHVLEAWQRRNNPNLLYVFFEDMKKDLRGVITKVAEFLAKKLTDENLAKLEDHLSFKTMKNNKWVNWEWLAKSEWADSSKQFYRKGAVGDWKNHFSPELTQRFTKWMEENLKGTDLKFATE